MGDYNPSRGHIAFNTVGAAGGVGWIAEQLGLFGNGCGNSGGLFNNKNNGDCYVTEKEFAYAQQVNAKDARIAELESKDYTDAVGLDLYKNIISETKAVDEKQSENIKVINAELVRMREENAVMKSDLRCLSILNQEQHKALATEFNSALALESERRACGDENIVTYVNSNFIKGTLKLDAGQICPQVQLKCEDVQLVELVSNAVTQALAKK